MNNDSDIPATATVVPSAAGKSASVGALKSMDSAGSPARMPSKTVNQRLVDTIRFNGNDLKFYTFHVMRRVLRDECQVCMIQ